MNNTATVSDLVKIDDFAQIQLRTGKVLSAEPIPKSSKLLILKVDLGEDKPRQIVAGVAAFYSPEDLVGRQIVVVANLEPAKLMGVESQGMLLAAENPDGSQLTLLTPSDEIAVGSKIR